MFKVKVKKAYQISYSQEEYIVYGLDNHPSGIRFLIYEDRWYWTWAFQFEPTQNSGTVALPLSQV